MINKWKSKGETKVKHGEARENPLLVIVQEPAGPGRSGVLKEGSQMRKTSRNQNGMKPAQKPTQTTEENELQKPTMKKLQKPRRQPHGARFNLKTFPQLSQRIKRKLKNCDLKAALQPPATRAGSRGCRVTKPGHRAGAQRSNWLQVLLGFKHHLLSHTRWNGDKGRKKGAWARMSSSSSSKSMTLRNLWSLWYKNHQIDPNRMIPYWSCYLFGWWLLVTIKSLKYQAYCRCQDLLSCSQGLALRFSLNKRPDALAFPGRCDLPVFPSHHGWKNRWSSVVVFYAAGSKCINMYQHVSKRGYACVREHFKRITKKSKDGCR